MSSGAGPMSALSRVRLDEFTIAMLATVMLAFLLPCRGTSAEIFGDLAGIAIGLLFFLQGARLSRAAIIAGALHWRLHLVIFAASFVLFPVVGLALPSFTAILLTPPLYLGFLFLCTLPSTVQDSVAFTSIAGGNVAAALCSASASSIFGMFLTPLLAGLVLHAHGALSLDALRSIGLEMVLPFIAGQLLQPCDRELGAGTAARLSRRRRSRLGAAGGLHRVQRSRFERDLAPARLRTADGALRRRRQFARADAGDHRACRTRSRLLPRGSNRDHILRLEKEPRHRDPDGEFAVCRPRLGPHRPAIDGVLSDPAHGLRRARPALRQSCEIARDSHPLRRDFGGQSYPRL